MSDNPILKIMLLAVTCSPTATGQLHVERHGHEDAKSDPTWPPNDQQEDELGDFLAVSPYTTLPHLLDLRPLEGSERLLAKALAVLEPVREDYATSPYAEAFNWDEVIDRLQSLMQLSKSGFEWKHQYFYIVVFRSQIPTTTDRRHLGELDQQSHAEATKSGGLLKYWYGLPDESGRNLATCKTRGHYKNLEILLITQAYGADAKMLDQRPPVRGTRKQ